MSLRRGDIVLVAVKGPYTSKPRPVVIVQATETLDLMQTSVLPQLLAPFYSDRAAQEALGFWRERPGWTHIFHST